MTITEPPGGWLDAEGRARALGGSIRFERHSTIATFREPEAHAVFVLWLTERGYQILDAGTSALCVSYARERF